ncbi:MAG: tetratricopeptide repeat protein [Gammaproteobacteria bacterium]|nr:tetratricopeptide repeat protein [Gammaproteobacteria bacterium]
MPALPLFVWILIPLALAIGILAGHYGWGRRFVRRRGRMHPDYLAGLDFLINEQPDRALDRFLKVMDTSADSLETHFALGSLYRRRGETDRAIRVHRNLLARGLTTEHREQALLALAQDYLRAGLLDRAEDLFRQVSEGNRLRSRALEALRAIYERQRDWPQALETYRRLEALDLVPPRAVAAHYLCEMAAHALERGDLDESRRLLREARRRAPAFPRAALLRAQVAEREGRGALALGLLGWAVERAPRLLQDELAHLLRLAGEEGREKLLDDLVLWAEAREGSELKGLVYAVLAVAPDLAGRLRDAVERVVAREPTLHALHLAAAGAPFGVFAAQASALLARAETHRCADCGFTARRFYWQCPGCQAWDSFENCVIIKLR